MARRLEELEAEVLDLPDQDRARLARRLILSLEDTPLEDPAEVEKAWEEEIQRRVAEVEAGTADLIPADVAFAEIRKSLQR
jgi:putative addiction module component (TIGR02574 family)